MDSVLTGVRVLDLTSLLPGPYCTMYLADQGADVLKVERPGHGDPTRNYGAPIAGHGANFLALNRNKRSVTLNLKHPAGREVFLDLVPTADVVVEGFRPGTMDRLGLGYETLQAANPAVICCSLSGYGQDGPYRDRVGHDLNYLAEAGVLDLIGERDGLPAVPGIQMADMHGAALGALAIVMALFSRQRTGRGQYIDLALMDGVFEMLALQAAHYFATGKSPRRGDPDLAGGWHAYRVYETADRRHLTLAAWEENFWRNFCTLADRPDLAALHGAAGDQGAWVTAELEELFRSRTLAEWLAITEGAETCIAPVRTVAEAVAHPQAVHRRMTFTVTHPDVGEIRQIANPIRFVGNEGQHAPPPRLGQHTAEVLQELGYDAAKLARLAEMGVI